MQSLRLRIYKGRYADSLTIRERTASDKAVIGLFIVPTLVVDVVTFPFQFIYFVLTVDQRLKC